MCFEGFLILYFAFVRLDPLVSLKFKFLVLEFEFASLNFDLQVLDSEFVSFKFEFIVLDSEFVN